MYFLAINKFEFFVLYVSNLILGYISKSLPQKNAWVEYCSLTSKKNIPKYRQVKNTYIRKLPILYESEFIKLSIKIQIYVGLKNCFKTPYV